MKTYKILYIDDNVADLETIARSLRLDGHTAIPHADGLQGLDAARAEHPDYILLDIYLRGEVDGIVLANLLHKEMPDIPIIAVTQVLPSENPTLKQQMYAAGCSAYIQKPIHVETVYDRIEELETGHGEILTIEEELQYLRRNSQEFAENIERRIHRMQEQVALVTKLQQELQAANHRVDVGEWSSVVAHQLKNPITAILLNMDNMQYEKPDSATWRRYFDAVRVETQRLNEITHLLMEAKNPSLENYQELDWVRLLDDFLDSRPTVKNRISINYLKQYGVFITYGAREWMYQLLDNIIGNAIDAAGDSASMTIEFSANPRELEIRFTDNGPGLEDPNQAFTLFYTTKSDGHGIGLYISQLIAKVHRGNIVAKNHPAGGAVFVLTLPTQL